VVKDLVHVARGKPMVIAILEAHIVVDEARPDDDDIGLDSS
jgi:hypothetical protein